MRRLVPLIAIVLLASGCAGLRLSQTFRSAPDDWTLQGGAPDRRSVSASAPALPWQRIWEYNAQGGILASPLVRDSIVIIATLHGELQAVDLRNGRRLGYEKMGAPIHGTPAIHGVTAIVPLSTENSSLVAFDMRENRIVWKATAGPIESAVLLEGNDIYVATLEGNVLKYDARSGEERWRTGIGPKKDRKPIRTGPVFAVGSVIVGSDDGTVTALNTSDGARLWTATVSGSIFAGPVVVGDFVVVGDIRGTVAAFDVTSGAVRWKQDAEAPIYGSPSSDGKQLYVPTSSGRLWALDAATGVVQWSYQNSSVLNAAPLVAGDRLLVPSLDRSVTILDAAMGQLIDVVTFDGRVKVSPIVWRGYVIVVAEDKYVSAFLSAGGTE